MDHICLAYCYIPLDSCAVSALSQISWAHLRSVVAARDICPGSFPHWEPGALFSAWALSQAPRELSQLLEGAAGCAGSNNQWIKSQHPCPCQCYSETYFSHSFREFQFSTIVTCSLALFSPQSHFPSFLTGVSQDYLADKYCIQSAAIEMIIFFLLLCLTLWWFSTIYFQILISIAF